MFRRRAGVRKGYPSQPDGSRTYLRDADLGALSRLIASRPASKTILDKLTSFPTFLSLDAKEKDNTL
jgi:hypothetical protein